MEKRGPSGKGTLAERRAEALRRNLQRRKLQARGRAAEEKGSRKPDGNQSGR